MDLKKDVAMIPFTSKYPFLIVPPVIARRIQILFHDVSIIKILQGLSMNLVGEYLKLLLHLSCRYWSGIVSSVWLLQSDFLI